MRTRESVEHISRPAETIGSAKQDALRYAAERWLRQLDGREKIYYRFDAVEVLMVEGRRPDCTLIENLFS